MPAVTLPPRVTHEGSGQQPSAGELPQAVYQAKPSRPLKRALDIALSVSGLILLSPLLVGISIAIKLTSKGHVLFRQERHGLNGNTFILYKFRSMYADRCDRSGVQQTVKGDRRITPVGRFLRQSNFDELPQLFNVLKGDMSIVGPRPHVPGMLANGMPYEQFDPLYQSRHQVRPGITGLAQANGFRGETRDPYAAHMRLYYDLTYIDKRSTWLDFKIIMATLVREFIKGNGS
ncbi:sugar transferase [Roseibium algae]|uniref:Sugar transferase n=1 Tax=Roseibium algae TaxID=3123038 RepID=A0ABU8TI54_9HYPH